MPMHSDYKRPILATIYRIFASIALILGIVGTLISGNIIAGAVVILSAFVILGFSEIFELIGKIEYNTRPENQFATVKRDAVATQMRGTKPTSITGI